MSRYAPVGVVRHGIATASAIFVVIALLVGATVAISAVVMPETQPLNYSAYQITGSSAEITFLYSFPSTSGVGFANMSWADYGPIFFNTSATFMSCGPITNCSAILVSPSVQEASYLPDSSLVVTFTVEVARNGTLPSPYFLFFPPYAPCGYYLFLIFGNQIPSQVPSLLFTCPAIHGSYPQPSISVVSAQNMKGLNIPS